MALPLKINQFAVTNMIIDIPPKHLNISASEKLVLVCLSRYVDANAQCFPSISSLVDKAGVSTSTVTRTLRKFKGLGYITIGKKWCDHTNNVHNLYTLELERIETVARLNGNNVLKLVKTS